MPGWTLFWLIVPAALLLAVGTAISLPDKEGRD